MHMYEKLRCYTRTHIVYPGSKEDGKGEKTFYEKDEVIAFLRQDTGLRRVYIVPLDLDIEWYKAYEWVLYDFSIDTGDTLPVNAWNGIIGNRFTVIGTSEMTIGSKTLKTYQINNSASCVMETVIEGIGCLNAFFSTSGDLIRFKNNSFEYIP